MSVSPNVQGGLLYAIRESGNTLVSIDTDTLALTSIGLLGIPYEFGGLAYDPGSDVLYGVDGRGNRSLFSINRSTGAATTIGIHGVQDLFGLAFDSQNGVLYGSVFGGSLFTLNTSTGSATLVGGSNGSGGLAYDSLNDRLVGIFDGAGDLYNINRTNASQTLLFNGPFTNNSGLAFDRDKNLFWDIDWNGNLYSYDPTNGYARTTHLTGLGPHDGLEYVSNVTATPEPATMALLGLTGLAGLGLRLRRRQNQQTVA